MGETLGDTRMQMGPISYLFRMNAVLDHFISCICKIAPVWQSNKYAQVGEMRQREGRGRREGRGEGGGGRGRGRGRVGEWEGEGVERE